MAVITDTGQKERARAVSNSLASVRMEGLEPSEEGQAILQRYVDGELTLEEMGRAVDEHLNRVHGPIRLPRDDRP